MPSAKKEAAFSQAAYIMRNAGMTFVMIGYTGMRTKEQTPRVCAEGVDNDRLEALFADALRAVQTQTRKPGRKQ